MTSAPLWAHIPAELCSRPQWCIAGPDKSPHAVGPNGLYRASVTDPKTWMPFLDAANYAFAHGLHIGYVITDNDAFACIDLDVVDADSQTRKGKAVDPAQWTTAEQFDRYWSIVQHFASYTERSTWGKGLHIWVRANIGHGCKRDGVEVYSQERFIICTGDRISPPGVGMEDRQAMLDNMVSQMRGINFKASTLVEVEEEDSDEEIYERASTAANADKFNALCAGQWEAMGFPSQSEADLALMSMFTFYSKSNEQCRRLFRCTALGKRAKAVKDDRYLNFTLTVIRGRQEQEARFASHGASLASELVKQLNTKAQQAADTPLSVAPVVDPPVYPTPLPVAAAQSAPVPAQVLESRNEGIPYPPGFAGHLAEFVYASAPRPVKEVAIVAALGMLAGVCGKAWYIQGSGLNIYMILIARSAIGKEAMHSGVSLMLNGTMTQCPGIMQFVNFNDFASGPALVKACNSSPSFVNVAGEWGRKLRKLAMEDGRDGPMATLRTMMTNLYQKSGPQSIVGGINYSKAEDNVASVTGVAYSMIGETTPGTFYEALTESMMEDGFLSRFNLVEYDGDRPELNKNPVTKLPAYIADHLGGLARKALQVNSTMNGSVPVERDAESAAMLAQFEIECDRQINSTKDESWRQMWNRAALKVMRIAALLAVGDNYGHPVVRKEHVDWALMLIRKDIQIMQKRMQSGDVGTSDFSRERKILSILEEYLRDGPGDGYKVPATLHSAGIVPRKYLQTRCARSAAFSQHKLGSTAALDHAIRSLVDSGYLLETDKKSLADNHSFYGKAYMVLNVK